MNRNVTLAFCAILAVATAADIDPARADDVGNKSAADRSPSEPGPLLQRSLAGPLAGVEEVVFAERVPGHDHWYANFGYYWCGRVEYPEQRLPEDWRPSPIFQSGGKLCRVNLATGGLTVLLEDRRGGVRDRYAQVKPGTGDRPGRRHRHRMYPCAGARPTRGADNPKLN